MPQFENGWNIFSVNSTGYTVEYHVKKITNDNSLVYGRDYDVYDLGDNNYSVGNTSAWNKLLETSQIIKNKPYWIYWKKGTVVLDINPIWVDLTSSIQYGDKGGSLVEVYNLDDNDVTNKNALEVLGNTYLKQDLDVLSNLHIREKKQLSIGYNYPSKIVTYVVTVGAKTSAHPYYGSPGSGNAYYLNGVESPAIVLQKGFTYIFDQSDSSNDGHPLKFYYTAQKNNVIGSTSLISTTENSGTPGYTDAKTTLLIDSNITQNTIYYQCVNHSFMGGNALINEILIDISGTTAIQFPVGNTNERPVVLRKGLARYNIETNQFEGYGAGNAWASLGGVIDVDQDTYISPETSAGADNDQLQFYTAGSERMIIDSNGKVGIGVTNPDIKLDITSHFTSTTADGNIRDTLRLHVNTNYQSFHGLHWYNDNHSFEMGAIRMNVGGGYDNCHLSFWTSKTRATPTEKMRITSDGNVGIGTIPETPLHIKKNGTSDGQVLTVSRTGDGACWLDLDCNSNNTTTHPTYPRQIWSIGSDSNGNLDFYKRLGIGQGNFRMSIGGNGNVGIGTRTPQAKLSISENQYTTIGGTQDLLRLNVNTTVGDSNHGIEWYQTRTSYPDGSAIPKFSMGAIRMSVGSGYNDCHLSFWTSKNTATSTEKMRITSDGNVGIGTNNPETPLHIEKAGSVTGQVLKISNTTAGSACWLELECNPLDTPSNPRQEWGIGSNTNGNLEFFKRVGTGANNFRMTITGTGDVGIGTQTPNAKLDVDGNIICQDISCQDISCQALTVGNAIITSDNRYKHNQKEIKNALSTLEKLNPKVYLKTSNAYETNQVFDLNSDGLPINDSGELIKHIYEAGLIAQDIQNIDELKKFVSGNERLGLNYNSIFSYMVAALKELNQKYKDEKSKVSSLESQMKNVLQRLSNLEK